jgi:hypothetical protein
MREGFPSNAEVTFAVTAITVNKDTEKEANRKGMDVMPRTWATAFSYSLLHS